MDSTDVSENNVAFYGWSTELQDFNSEGPRENKTNSAAIEDRWHCGIWSGAGPK